MRIDRIHIRNFKCFDEMELELNPRFTLLVGDNGTGKTTMLDALAVAAGVWLVKPPDSALVGSGRNILPGEIRLLSTEEGDRTNFLECKPVSVRATGELVDRTADWCRQIRKDGTRTTNAEARTALRIIERHYERVRDGQCALSPVIAYYGAGRAWLPSRSRREPGTKRNGPARRWEALHGCFNELIRLTDLNVWFQREALAFASRSGSWRPGYGVVKRAILDCVPDADNLWYDGDRGELVLSFDGQARTFANLSAGQRMMVALIADIAIKAVAQNAYLVTQDPSLSDGEQLPEVLQRTPGLVLIDEIDAHLHPDRQRQVVGDLKRTFPSIQFVCTSHSPFIIQSLETGELRSLEPGGAALAEYSGRSIEDIAEDIQRVEVPQLSREAADLNQASEQYFKLLQEWPGGEKSEELMEAEANYRRVAERHSANPGPGAILKLDALARSAERSN